MPYPHNTSPLTDKLRNLESTITYKRKRMMHIWHDQTISAHDRDQLETKAARELEDARNERNLFLHSIPLLNELVMSIDELDNLNWGGRELPSES